MPEKNLTRPLFKRFPDLASVAAINPIAALPTPVEALSFSSNGWIKRDDITHSEYGGNKIRKLEFTIAEAKRRGAKRIVTFGAIGTNHGVATSMLCQQNGLECVVYVFAQPVTPTVVQNLKLMQAFGAKLVYKGSLAKTVLAFYLSPYRLKSNSYCLFAGGSNVFGTLAFVNAAFELKQQIENGDCPAPETIVCPVGSSATLAGLTYGCQLAGLSCKVIGVRVVPEKLGPLDACSEGTVSRLMHGVHKWLSQHLTEPLPTPCKPHIDHQYFGDGYGAATAKGLAAIEQFSDAGYKLEQTYSGKAAAAFLDQLVLGKGPVLFWHTYNSRIMKERANAVNASDLPKPLRQFLV